MMNTPFSQSQASILEHCKENGVLLFVAPTGSGKTTGFQHLVGRNKHIFGRTCFIQPTRMAAQSSVRSMTPIQVLEYYFKNQTFACDTFILDEVHSRSVEYETILNILSIVKSIKKIILLTATADIDHLQSFFPHMRVIELNIQSPFPVAIEYRNNRYSPNISIHQIIPQIKDDILENKNHERILVFMATHEQCDKLAKEFRSFAQKYNLGETKALYGGFTHEEYVEWQSFQQNNQRFVIFATNVAEVSITIPGLSLIIDPGIHCIQQHSRIIHDFCPRSNLIQRAGRTGRTCPGKVIRYMSEDQYYDLPYQNDPEYNWDIMVLRMFRHRMSTSILKIDCTPIYDKFKFYGVIRDDRLDETMARFIVNSPLLFKYSCCLYEYMRNPSADILFVIMLAMIDIFEARMLRSFYFSEDLKMSRTEFLDRFIKIFSCRNDELELQFNIFCSCLLAPDPFEFSKRFYLNFKTFRYVRSHIQKTIAYAYPDQKDWVSYLKGHDFFSAYNRKGFIGNDVSQILRIQRRIMNQIQHIFFRMKTILRMSVQQKYTNVHVSYYNCMIRPSNKNVIVFFHDDPDISVKTIIEPVHHESEDFIDLYANMYTSFPDDIDKHLMLLSYNINKMYSRFCAMTKEKNKIIEQFQSVLRDIEEDVAYRPFQYKMMEMIQDFWSFLQSL